MQSCDSTAVPGGASETNLNSTSVSSAAHEPNASPSALELEISKIDFDDMSEMLPDFGNADHDFFNMVNTLAANTDLTFGSQDDLQDTIALARAQLQERMDVMASTSATIDQTGGEMGNMELPVPNVEPVTHDLNFDNEEPEDSSEVNEAFESLKREYEAKRNPSLEDRLLFQKAQNEELQRLNRLKSRKENHQDMPASVTTIPSSQFDYKSVPVPGLGDEPYELFCSDNVKDVPNQAPEQDPSVDQHKAPAPSRPGRGRRVGPATAIASKDKRQNAASGFDAFRRSKGKASSSNGVKKGTSTRGSKGSKTTKTGKWKSKSRKQKQKRQVVNMNFDSLFSSNIISAAKANALKPALPKASAKAKDKVLKELIASVPHADPKVVTTDKNAIMAAIVKFSKRPRADGQGNWLHPDMKTSLFHYQLLGVGFMRDRENSAVAPFGGFLCDEMGFGKTIQTIANIVDGKPGPDDKVKTTLIIVPPHLINHWLCQLREHCKPNVLGGILEHHSASRVPDDVFNLCLDRMGVILTTYSEVRKSYPDIELPMKESEKQAKWRTIFYENCGPLHRIQFHRIILDEAHEIKNHMSRTSMAVRMLTGKFRWVITGTPIHNTVLEFFPYFEFLKIPQTGNFERFCRNYCPDGQANHARLSSLLRGYMLRRTHEETLFGLPILKLPDIDENTLVIRFSHVEKLLYREIIKFVMQQYMHISEDNDDTVPPYHSYNGKWTLLLRLRLFTSHILLAQEMLKDILTDKVMEFLHKAVGADAEPEDLAILDLLDKLRVKVPLPTLDDMLESRTAEPERKYTMGEEIINRFREALAINIDLKNCQQCKSPSYAAYILTCMHIYCNFCISRLTQYPNGYVCLCGPSVQESTYCNSIPSLYGSALATRDMRNGITIQHMPDAARAGERGLEDWVIAAGHLMPSAKLTAVRSCVANWLNGNPDTKVTIFTQFLGMVDILSSMCLKEGWGHTTLTGRVAATERHKDIEEFRTDPEVRVLISSLKAGGTGLNLTMADKCILVDLWWNEAIEQQAFCRLFRYGQKKDVEIVRITVKNSIDDRIQLIQNAKTASIEKTMGADALSVRDTLEDIMKIFGVAEDETAEDGFVFLSEDEV